MSQYAMYDIETEKECEDASYAQSKVLYDSSGHLVTPAIWAEYRVTRIALGHHSHSPLSCIEFFWIVFAHASLEKGRTNVAKYPRACLTPWVGQPAELRGGEGRPPSDST
jgi:hypothetical protein